MKQFFILAIVLVNMTQYAVADANASDDEWHFTIAPLFLWGMGIEGTQSIGPTDAALDIEFKDALSNLDAVFTVHFEAQKQDLILFAEYQMVDLAPGVELPDGSAVDINFKNKMGELGLGYRVGQFDTTDLEVLVGARYVEQDLKVQGIPLVSISSLKRNEDWWDGFLGLRTRTRFADNWQFVARVDYGAGDSDGTWNLAGMFDYRFRDWGSVFFGYKWMDFDFESGEGLDRYAYDATQKGPLAGVNFYW